MIQVASIQALQPGQPTGSSLLPSRNAGLCCCPLRPASAARSRALPGRVCCCALRGPRGSCSGSSWREAYTFPPVSPLLWRGKGPRGVAPPLCAAGGAGSGRPSRAACRPGPPRPSPGRRGQARSRGKLWPGEAAARPGKCPSPSERPAEMSRACRGGCEGGKELAACSGGGERGEVSAPLTTPC